MKANYGKLKKKETEVAMGTLYDVNKQMMMNEPTMTAETREEKIKALQEWLVNKFENQYFMLLCHELRDYTLFNLDAKLNQCELISNKCINAAIDVLNCMDNRGVLLTADLQEDGVWEIWMRNEEGCFAYYLFPYGNAVLEY